MTKTSDGEIEYYDVDYQATIHWDSLNQPLEPGDFQLESDPTDVLKEIQAAKTQFGIE